MKKLALELMLVVALTTSLASSGIVTAIPEQVDVIIGFNREVGPAEEALVLDAGGVIRHTYRLVRAAAASVPATAVQRLLKNPAVSGIEFDTEVFTADIELDNSWGVNHLSAGIVHENGNKGTGVKVAIIDTGIDYNHPDLADNYAGGYDFVNGDDDPMDDNGHGTHVAGTIAARDDGTGVVGVAPEVRLYALKVLNARGRGRSSDVIAALEWSIKNGIQITNNSYGRATDPGPLYRVAFDKAYDAGILHIASSGNDGNPDDEAGDTVKYPARLDSVIAVAAVDKNDVRAKWSSAGPEVELAAPGVGINSTLPGGGYGIKNGTSMAAPHIAGLAALLITAGMKDANGNGRINDEVRQKLVSTAKDLGENGRDALYGYGVVDARVIVSGLVAPATIQGTAPDGTNPTEARPVNDSAYPVEEQP